MRLALLAERISAATLSGLEAALQREERPGGVVESPDFVEDVTAFQQRRKPNFTDS
jgi:enoyl-CoA hydratase